MESFTIKTISPIGKRGLLHIVKSGDLMRKGVKPLVTCHNPFVVEFRFMKPELKKFITASDLNKFIIEMLMKGDRAKNNIDYTIEVSE